MKVDEAAKRAWAEIKRRIVGYCELAKIEMPEMSDEIGAEIITAEYAKNMPWADFKDVLAARAAWEELRRAAERLPRIASGIGRCSAVPCFDQEDYATENARRGWVVTDADAWDRLVKALSSLPKEGQ